MSSDLRLVIFDVDGTLIDSQSDILAAFAQAFAHVGRELPAPAQIMSIVGLSLDVAIARLVPDISDADGAAMVEAYKDAYVALRASAPRTTVISLLPRRARRADPSAGYSRNAVGRGDRQVETRLGQAD